MRKVSVLVLTMVLLSACVSKKKYVALEQDRDQIKGELHKTAIEKDELEAKFAAIEAKVDAYNAKINALKEENDAKLTTSDGSVISNDAKKQMRATISKMDPEAVKGAKTLKDSMNLAVSYNLKQTMAGSELSEDSNGEVDININETVVMITIADNLLFKTASYRMSNKADGVLQKIADLLKSEPSLDLMVEGHTDSRTISNARVADNWDLSVLRATSIVRRMQDKFGVDPSRLIASGRSSYQPLVDNDTKENRAKNRRTRIVILPNIDKFFALMAEK
ncbi:cell envelope biogenesis protein OmpA [Aureibaculum marinum]|uniref:Cell envelope biogenesis protein OmpA n=1 Tax=Aureibaculum marinum TaxID=2487930 RepID=A0A3N4NQN7_9FLAO|nr:OmpA family protein [Aureibaculum marinum]RPD97945.1 cell envelope biogenesis protein OmpA [Aureibaculum marinum]